MFNFNFKHFVKGLIVLGLALLASRTFNNWNAWCGIAIAVFDVILALYFVGIINFKNNKNNEED